jgi:2-polyprenyl-3-methyl-5-hydroxy-6-metoxy-1,4-benzoquinol methylase
MNARGLFRGATRVKGAVAWRLRKNRLVGRRVLRLPEEVVKDNTAAAYDYFFAHEFIERSYLSERRFAFYDLVAGYCSDLLQDETRAAPPLELVDVGCGTGHLLLGLRERLGDAVRLTAIDFSAVAVARTRALVPGARGVVASVYDLPSPDGSFDVLVCTEVLEHLERPHDALAELFRVVRPGGHLVITVPNGPLDRCEEHVNHWTVVQFRGFLGGGEVREVVLTPDQRYILAHVIRTGCAGPPG